MTTRAERIAADLGAVERLIAWVEHARPWVQDDSLRHAVDDLVPARKRQEGS